MKTSGIYGIREPSGTKGSRQEGVVCGCQGCRLYVNESLSKEELNLEGCY